MKKKEYIEKLENLILQRVKYHAPKLNSNEIDYSLLDIIGINPSYPIFIFKKPLNKTFLKAFGNAKRHAQFNLILFEKPLFNIKKLAKLPKTYLIYKEELGGNLYNTLEALNINYLSHSEFKNELRGEYIKINGQELAFDFIPYFYRKKAMFDGVVVDVRQFILNGKNSTINLINTRNIGKNVKIELNIPLPRGYYFFKTEKDFVQIENLTNKEKAYFNYNFKRAKISFSNISGLESSTFACVNITCEISLLPHEKLVLYYNFGEHKYCLSSPNMIEYFFDLSQKKINEIFDIKVKTRDINFDNDFNLYLPRKIWEKWQNFEVDEEGINNWLKMRSKIVRMSEKGEQISSYIKGLKEVKFFRNSSWKRVFVLHNNSNYLYANKVKYFNYNLLTKEIFEKNNEIYLSFAD